MKKIFVAIAVVLLIPGSITLNNVYTNYKVQKLKQFNSITIEHIIVFEDTSYEFYGSLYDDTLTGNQIGIVNGIISWKVYEIKGLSSNDWILEIDEGEMDINCVYKATHVTDIPAVIKPFNTN